MTAGEVIALVDELRPNQYSAAQKLRWLRRLDGQILAELEDTHSPAAGTAIPAPGGPSPLQEDPAPAEAAAEEGSAAAEETADGGGETAPSGGLPGSYASDTELLAPFPYAEELYTAYLFCQIDLHNAEIQKYSQSLSLLQAAWRQLADFINRRRLPRGARCWRV